jgi:hypothetical protein
MRLRLSDPGYTDRLATFLRSLGQTVSIAAPDRLDVDTASVSAVGEIQIYVRVWKVLYPDAEVGLEKGEGFPEEYGRTAPTNESE